MISRKRKKGFNLYWFSIFILSIVLSMSVGYSLWAGNLKINGIINTGNHDMNFVKVCSHAVCCGCSSNVNYTWSSHNIDINLKYNSHHCKLFTIAKIKNAGSIPSVLRRIYVNGLNNNTHLHIVFLNNVSNTCPEFSLYSQELYNGWNLISPTISINKGKTIYMGLLISFDGCGFCGCNTPENLTINLNLHWQVPNCLSSWSTDQGVTIRVNHT